MDTSDLALLIALLAGVIATASLLAIVMKASGAIRWLRDQVVPGAADNNARRRGVANNNNTDAVNGGGGDGAEQAAMRNRDAFLGGVSLRHLLTHSGVPGFGRGRGGWDANRPDSLPSQRDLETLADTLRGSAARRRATQRGTVSGGVEGAHPAGDEGDDHCPVCLEIMASAVEMLPCGHHVCAECLSQMLHHNGGGLRRLACPLDRTPTEALIPAFNYRRQLRLRYNLQIDDDAERRQDAELLRYNQSYAHTTTFQGLISLLRHLPQVARLLPWAVQLRALLTVLVGFLYSVSPLDFVPEIIFGVVGLVDDFLVVLIVAIVLANVVRNAWAPGR